MRCIESVNAQTYDNLQIILVDDGSTDGSGTLCDNFAQGRSNYLVIHKTNGGLSSARNAGLEVAKGDWVLFLDSDDALIPTACNDLIGVANKCNVDLVVGDAVHEIGDRTVELRHTALKPCVAYSNSSFMEIAIAHQQFYAPAWFNLYSRRFLESHNLMFKEGLLHEDMEMQPRVFLSARSIACSGKIFYRYIDRPNSIMNASKITARREAMTKIYSQWKSQFDSVSDERLRTYLYGHLAKCYLYTVRTLEGKPLKVNGVDGRFLFKSGLNAKEQMKALLYVISPKLLPLIGGKGDY